MGMGIGIEGIDAVEFGDYRAVRDLNNKSKFLLRGRTSDKNVVAEVSEEDLKKCCAYKIDAVESGEYRAVRDLNDKNKFIVVDRRNGYLTPQKVEINELRKYIKDNNVQINNQLDTDIFQKKV